MPRRPAARPLDVNSLLDADEDHDDQGEPGRKAVGDLVPISPRDAALHRGRGRPPPKPKRPTMPHRGL